MLAPQGTATLRRMLILESGGVKGARRPRSATPFANNAPLSRQIAGAARSGAVG